MTNPINQQNLPSPSYSGVTINISNPTVNPPCVNHVCSPNCQMHSYQGIGNGQGYNMNNPVQHGMTAPNGQNYGYLDSNSQLATQNASATEGVVDVAGVNTSSGANSIQQGLANSQAGIPQSYPPQYYLNNYNYIQNGEKKSGQTGTVYSTQPNTQNMPMMQNDFNNAVPAQDEEVDMSTSQGIIGDLDAIVAEQKELEKNGKQSRVVALTNEYIMSLEENLNNPNTEIRLMATKEILTRLDEDKERYDDAALNALLNKMLQDPEKIIRTAALSAFASQLACGNDYTVKLLTDIQNNPNSDKDDVVQAAESLLKMSSHTEIKYTPVENNYVAPEQQVEQ